MPPEQFVRGLVHPLAFALIAGTLLAMAAPSLQTYGKRVLFTALLGLLAAVWVGWGDAIWWFHPWKYVLGSTAYHVVSAVLMGIILGAVVKARKETA